MPLKIICASPSRTGTKSFSAALRHLGYKVYDWEENCFYHGKEWEEIIKYGYSNEMFQKMYANVDAVVDQPSFYFWEEILQAFPDAKVVLMERESEKWVESLKIVSDVWHFRPIIYQIQPYFSRTSMQSRNTLELSCGQAYAMSTNSFSRPWRRHTPFNKQLAMKRYQDHMEHVKTRAPKDQLLVFNVTQGWEPLCKFLGHKVPDIPFPHLNKGANMISSTINEDLVRQVNKEMRITLLKYAVLIGIATFGCYCCKKKDGIDWMKDVFKSITNKVFNML